MTWADIPNWAYPTARALLAALREKDPYTYGHCCRVAAQAKLLAKDYGLNEFQQRVVELGSLFHDLGKMGIPDSILQKPGKLTRKEEVLMKEHPMKSAQIISPLAETPLFEASLPGILHHHERVDGLGYPFGVSGDAIPVESRIILVADTYDAMTTDRPYRKGLPAEIAYKEIELFAGRQFDSQVVKTFLQAHPLWKQKKKKLSEELLIPTHLPTSMPKAA
jgi:putative nucleotidyltransferase with HDIG domain